MLESKPTLQSGEAWEVWLVKAESLLTQIDAGFAQASLPEGLAAIRASLTTQAETITPAEAVKN